MKLNYKVFGDGEPLIILHGLFGSLDNWLSIARQLGDDGFKTYIVDQRNHGKSPHSDEHNFDAMAADLLEFMDDHKLEKAHLIGHSMGGKTVMTFANKHPYRVEKLVVVDIGIKDYGSGHDEIFDALLELDPASFKSRSEAEDELGKRIQEDAVKLFLLKNLERKDDGGYKWKMNLPVLEREYENINTKVEAEIPNLLPVLFIKGSYSNYIREEDKGDIKKLFPLAEFVTIDGAGHWVHAEKPEEFKEALLDFIK